MMKRNRPKLFLMKSFLLIAALHVTFLLTFPTRINAQTRSKPSAAQEVIERGKFRIYELNQPQGEESYEVRRDRSGLVVKSTFKLPYWGEELKPSLNATLRMRSDLTPSQFEIAGIRPLEVRINTSVSIRGHNATVSEGTQRRQVIVPDRFFTLSGYAPVTMEMMLIRYWLNSKSKAPLKLLPGGEAIIEPLGRDTATVDGKQISLERYSLGGIGWGRQTLWFDSQNKLVAAVNLGGDVETNFSAIRDGYESIISFFLKRAVEDGVDRLTQEANRLSPARTGALVLLGGTLIDGTGKTPLVDSVIVIEGDRIKTIGTRSEVKIPDGATIVDARGKYIVPGLWDMHAHFYQVDFGPAYLAAGITTARDVGNDFEFATALRDAARSGRGLGPGMLLAGYIDGKNPDHSFDIQVETPAEARAAVQHYKEAGFEQIKIRDNVKLDTLKVITAEAHRLGMTVTGHVPKGMDALQAVEAGMDQINHINFVAPVFESKGQKPNDESSSSLNLESPEARHALQVFKDKGTVIDPTLATMELVIRPKNVAIKTFEPGMERVAPELVEQLEKKGTPPEAAAQVREYTRLMLAIVGALHRAGIPIVAGTDVSVPGHSLHRELELYVQAGFTPLEAIQAASLVPARAMKLENEVGTIEAGKRADVLIVEANPLDNISNIRKLKFVIAQGRLYDCARLWQSVGFKP
jgi:imidazolonepropionase-like amidohydrolase